MDPESESYLFRPKYKLNSGYDTGFSHFRTLPMETGYFFFYNATYKTQKGDNYVYIFLSFKLLSESRQ